MFSQLIKTTLHSRMDYLKGHANGEWGILLPWHVLYVHPALRLKPCTLLRKVLLEVICCCVRWLNWEYNMGKSCIYECVFWLVWPKWKNKDETECVFEMVIGDRCACLCQMTFRGTPTSSSSFHQLATWTNKSVCILSEGCFYWTPAAPLQETIRCVRGRRKNKAGRGDG